MIRFDDVRGMRTVSLQALYSFPQTYTQVTSPTALLCLRYIHISMDDGWGRHTQRTQSLVGMSDIERS